jgi:hypothetical protein
VTQLFSLEQICGDSSSKDKKVANPSCKPRLNQLKLKRKRIDSGCVGRDVHPLRFLAIPLEEETTTVAERVSIINYVRPNSACATVASASWHGAPGTEQSLPTPRTVALFIDNSAGQVDPTFIVSLFSDASMIQLEWQQRNRFGIEFERSSGPTLGKNLRLRSKKYIFKKFHGD